ncbi:hypothetical protein AB0M46_31555 [Dactylosporangium sp. NPDC051485]|uniref:hypothetical protein n=1 Tax=Dactylosporangium sp. NPDC051485 TaxID=3154846 RepID=UPI0034323B7A
MTTARGPGDAVTLVLAGEIDRSTVRAQRLGREAGVAVEVANPSAVVARVLTVTGVFHVLVGAA